MGAITDLGVAMPLPESMGRTSAQRRGAAWFDGAIFGVGIRTTMLVAVLALVGCAPTDVIPETAEPSTTPPSSVATVDGSFEVEAGRSLALACVGEGSPTVIYDAGTGTSGIATLSRASQVSAEVQALSSRTRVCSFDRAGIGQSDPAPNRARTVDDLVEDLHALLAEAGVPGPYLLVGSSGRGGNVYHYAGRYPGGGGWASSWTMYRPRRPTCLPLEVPALDSPDNPEHIHHVLWEHQLAVDRLPIPLIPVTVLWATNGQSETQAEQALWLEGSSDLIQRSPCSRVTTSCTATPQPSPPQSTTCSRPLAEEPIHGGDRLDRAHRNPRGGLGRAPRHLSCRRQSTPSDRRAGSQASRLQQRRNGGPAAKPRGLLDTPAKNRRRSRSLSTTRPGDAPSGAPPVKGSSASNRPHSRSRSRRTEPAFERHAT